MVNLKILKFVGQINTSDRLRQAAIPAVIRPLSSVPSGNNMHRQLGHRLRAAADQAA
jgi:hypothetical protein